MSLSLESIGRVSREGASATANGGQESESFGQDVCRGTGPHHARLEATGGILDSTMEHEFESLQVPKIQMQQSILDYEYSIIACIWTLLQLQC